jgi:hypothetical protein
MRCPSGVHASLRLCPSVDNGIRVPRSMSYPIVERVLGRSLLPPSARHEKIWETGIHGVRSLLDSGGHCDRLRHACAQTLQGRIRVCRPVLLRKMRDRHSLRGPHHPGRKPVRPEMSPLQDRTARRPVRPPARGARGRGDSQKEDIGPGIRVRACATGAS